MRVLGDLLVDVEVLSKESFGEIEVGAVKTDSREVEEGDLFIAYKGVETDGHEYIKQAIEKGVKAVVGEKDMELDVPYIQVKNGRLAWAKIESAWYGQPERKLRMIGVTGTDGKTTTVSLIYNILQAAGKKVGMLSTVKAKIGDEAKSTGLHTTSPNPKVFFKFLSEMVEAGLEYAVVEVTSHALVQDRFGDSQFEVGVITNIASEHLDLHKSKEEYRKAKFKLVDKSEKAVLNMRTAGLEELKIDRERIVLFDRRREVAETKYVELEERVYQQFEMMYKGKWRVFKSQLLGEYNQENILAASKVAELLGIEVEKVQMGVGKLASVEGRFEKIANDKDLHVVVDFAHTAQSMREVLRLVREELLEEGKRIIVVFGCAGERDASKRRPMGQVAVALADLSIITAEDPRSEEMDEIFDEIEKGCKIARGKRGKDYLRVDDRREAIEEAIDKADKGDWVMILGKGHEQSLNMGGGEMPWSDVEVVREALSGGE